MSNIIVTARELLRDQRTIIERVKETKQQAVVVTNKKPQVAIVPLEDVEELRRLRQREALSRLVQFANETAKDRKYKSLPPDLGESHDKYLAEILEADLKRIDNQYDNN